MCPEQIAEALGTVSGSVYKPGDGHPEGSAALQAAYIRAMPALAFCLRFGSDSTVDHWVAELHRLEPALRSARVEEIAKGAPRGLGRRVTSKLLLRASESGSTRRILLAGGFGAYFGGPVGVADPLRKIKSGDRHHKMASLAETSDRIVRRLVAYPAGIEPAADTPAARRAEQRVLQEVASRLQMDAGGVESPSARRRSRS